MAKTVVIKKYENRRLYDTTNSRYVNLDEVAQMLQRGEDVQVVDAATGEDITRLILTQIIVEDAKTMDSAFPLDVLRQMVIASGRASQESTLKYMKAILDFYQSSYRIMTPTANPFDFMSGRTGEYGRGTEQPATNAADRAPAAPPARPPAATASEDVAEMKQRLAELEQIVSGLAPRHTRKKKSPNR